MLSEWLIVALAALLPRLKNARCQLARILGDPQSRFQSRGEYKNVLSLRGIELRFSGHPAVVLLLE